MNQTRDARTPLSIGLGGQIKGRVTAARDALDQLLEPDYRRLGVSAGEADVLTIVLLSAEPPAPTDLANRLGMTTAGMTSRLNSLEAAGLIERRPHATDGRRRILHLTEAGDELASTVLRLKDQLVGEHVVSALGDEQARSLVGYLDTVITAAVAAAANAGRPPL